MEHHASTYSVLTHNLGPRVGSKIRIFVSEVVMLRIKLKKIARSAPCKHLFCPNTPSICWVRSKGQSFFPDCVHVAYQLKRKEA